MNETSTSLVAQSDKTRPTRSETRLAMKPRVRLAEIEAGRLLLSRKAHTITDALRMTGRLAENTYRNPAQNGYTVLGCIRAAAQADRIDIESDSQKLSRGITKLCNLIVDIVSDPERSGNLSPAELAGLLKTAQEARKAEVEMQERLGTPARTDRLAVERYKVMQRGKVARSVAYGIHVGLTDPDRAVDLRDRCLATWSKNRTEAIALEAQAKPGGGRVW